MLNDADVYLTVVEGWSDGTDGFCDVVKKLSSSKMKYLFQVHKNEL